MRQNTCGIPGFLFSNLVMTTTKECSSLLSTLLISIKSFYPKVQEHSLAINKISI